MEKSTRRPSSTARREGTQPLLMRPAIRKLALAAHLTVSVGWIGAVIAYLGLGLSSVVTDEAETIRSAWIGMEITGWYVIVPLSAASLVTGLLMALGTKWGLFHHYWVIFSLVLTILASAVLLLHMPDVSLVADGARGASDASLQELGGDLLHPSLGLVVLVVVQVLNIYKPQGVTPHGRRKARTPTIQ